MRGHDEKRFGLGFHRDAHSSHKGRMLPGGYTDTGRAPSQSMES